MRKMCQATLNYSHCCFVNRKQFPPSSMLGGNCFLMLEIYLSCLKIDDCQLLLIYLNLENSVSIPNIRSTVKSASYNIV